MANRHATTQAYPPQPRLKSPTIQLPRIDTSYSGKQSLTSSLSGSTAATSSSSSWTANSRLEPVSGGHELLQPSPCPALPPSALPKNHNNHTLSMSSLSSASRKRHPDFIETKALYSPAANSSPSRPALSPLSARSASFVLAMHQCSKLFSTILESYLHQSSTAHAAATASPTYRKPACAEPTHRAARYTAPSPSRLPRSPRPSPRPPLSRTRKAIVAVCSLALALSLLVPALVVARRHLADPRAGQGLVMGGSGGVIFAAALIMLAARRSIKEILAMAAVGVTTCQCVMSAVSVGNAP